MMEFLTEIVVKGLAYEDVVSILYSNGYSTEVFTPSNEQLSKKNATEVLHHIRIYKQQRLDEE